MQAVREAMVIGLHDTRRALSSAKGIVLLTLFVGSFLLAGMGFVLASESAARRLRTEIEARRVEVDAAEVERTVKTQLFEQLARGDAELAKSLAETPAIVLFFFVSALFFLPGLVSLMGYDTISGDVQNRTVRYTLLRARRGSYLAGKFAGQTLLLGVFTLAANLVLLGMAAVRIPDFEFGAGLIALARYWSLAMLYGMVFVSATLLASTLTRYPLLALLGVFGALFVFGVLWMFGVSEWSLSFLSVLSPFSHWSRLFSPHAAELGGGIAIYLAFLGAQLGAAYLVVRSKDL